MWILPLIRAKETYEMFSKSLYYRLSSILFVFSFFHFSSIYLLRFYVSKIQFILAVSSNPYKALITAWNTFVVVGLEQLKIKTHTVENWKESLLQSNIFLFFMHSHIKTEKKKSLRPPCTINSLARSLGFSIVRISNSITLWIKEIKPLIA